MLPRPPLPITTAVVALLVVVPALLLTRWSRPRAAGLEQLIGASSLLQSFPPSPERPVPALWSERLGPDLARRLWRNQHKVWWQFWASHAESAPYLALSIDPSAPAAGPLPPQALRVGDLLVFAEDPVARQQLLASLRPLQRRSRGLFERCHQRLQSGQAVFWQADALGTILGPVAPLLERYQVGCLSLALEPDAVRWQGEASGAPSSAPGLPSKGLQGSELNPAIDAALGGGSSSLAVGSLPAEPPLPQDLLLELEGSSLDQLLQGLLARQMIRDPLASRYGLDGPGLAQVRTAPFRLRLHPLADGPFRASLDLLIPVGAARPTWEQVLDRLRRSLSEQGFTSSDATPLEGFASQQARSGPAATAPTLPGSPARPAASGSTPSSADAPSPAGLSTLGAATTPGPAKPPGPHPSAPEARSASPFPTSTLPSPVSPSSTGTTWKRPDGTPVGGWRWLKGQDGQAQLLFFLGPPPLAPLPLIPDQRTGPAASQLALRVRPSALDALGLLPPEMPALTRLASQLWLNSEPLGGAGPQDSISRLSGRLQLQR